MFEYLKGEIVLKRPEYLVVDINGVGYRISISLKTYDEVQENEIRKIFIDRKSVV